MKQKVFSFFLFCPISIGVALRVHNVKQVKNEEELFVLSVKWIGKVCASLPGYYSSMEYNQTNRHLKYHSHLQQSSFRLRIGSEESGTLGTTRQYFQVISFQIQ